MQPAAVPGLQSDSTWALKQHIGSTTATACSIWNQCRSRCIRRFMACNCSGGGKAKCPQQYSGKHAQYMLEYQGQSADQHQYTSLVPKNMQAVARADRGWCPESVSRLAASASGSFCACHNSKQQLNSLHDNQEVATLVMCRVSTHKEISIRAWSAPATRGTL